MNPSGLIAGQPVADARCFGSVVYRGICYLAFVTNNAISIVANWSSTEQIIQLNENDKINALAWNSLTGTLAIAKENFVWIYTPVLQGSERKWVKIKQIESDYEVKGISWFEKKGRILVCGSSVTIWKLPYAALCPKPNQVDKPDLIENPTIFWQIKCVSDIYFCSISPDNKYFVTAGEFDRIPKLWHDFYEEIETKIIDENTVIPPYDPNKTPEYELHFRFVYLPHPRAVTSLQWRPGKNSNIESMQNILLTTCRDGITRCWVETQTFCFSPSAVITSGGGDQVFSWLQYHPFLLNFFAHDEVYANLEQYDLEERMKEEVDILVEAENQNELQRTTKKIQRERFASGPFECKIVDDWIVGVEKDHLISFWRVSGINDFAYEKIVPSRNMPDLGLWLKTKVSRAHSFPQPILLLPLCLEVENEQTPHRIVFQMMNQFGVLCYWDLEITETSERRTGLPIKCTQYYGHSAPIDNSFPHPSSSLVASLSTQANEIILWQIADNKQVELTNSIQPIGHLLDTHAFTWLPNKEMFIVHHSSSIGQNKLMKLIYPRKGATGLQSLATFETLNYLNKPLALRDIFIVNFQENTFDLVGITLDGCGLYSWIITLDESSQNILESKLDFSIVFSANESILCYSIVPTKRNHNLLNYYAFATGGKDGVVRLWNKDDVDHKWQQVQQFQAHSSNLTEIQCLDSCRIMTLGHHGQVQEENNSLQASQAPSRIKMDIRSWEIFSNSPYFTLEQVIAIPEPIRKVSSIASLPTRRTNLYMTVNQREKEPDVIIHFNCFILANGQYIMTVSVDENVYLYLQRRSDDVNSFEIKWVREKSAINLSSACNSLNWCHNGNLIVTSLTQLLLYTQWMDLMPDANIIDKPCTSIQQATQLSDSLPAFHPKVLVQYLLAGKFDLVSDILWNLYKSIDELKSKNERLKAISIHQIKQTSIKNIIKKTDFSSSHNNASSSSSSNVNNNNNSYGSSSSSLFAPQTASSLFAPQTTSSLFAPQTASALFAPQTASALFAPQTASALFAPQSTSTIFASSEPEPPKEETVEQAEAKNGESHEKAEDEHAEKKDEDDKPTFTETDAEELAEYLSTITIAEITSKDQLYLISVINAFMQMQKLNKGLDDSGVRFLLCYKLAELTNKSQNQVQKDLTSRDFSWALHCEALEALTKQILPSETTTWEQAKRLGIGYWLTNPILLKEIIKNIAKAEFNLKKSPEDCAVFYVALGQTATLSTLFKASKNTKIAEFLLNDFTEQRWKTAADKNAFALLGRQQYRYAAAFFLLGGNLKGAIGICTRHLKDYNLPLVFCRLLEGENSESLKYLINTFILPQAEESHDAWLSSIASWLLKDYEKAIEALIPSPFIDDDQTSTASNLGPPPSNDQSSSSLFGGSLLASSNRFGNNSTSYSNAFAPQTASALFAPQTASALFASGSSNANSSSSSTYGSSTYGSSTASNYGGGSSSIYASSSAASNTGNSYQSGLGFASSASNLIGSGALESPGAGSPSLKSSTSSVTSGGSSHSIDTVASLLREDKIVTFDPCVVHLYRELIKKPFITRKPPIEREILLIKKIVHTYVESGCPSLALEEMMYLNHLEKILSDEVKKEKEAESKSSSNYFGGGFGGFIIMSEPEPEEEAKEEEKEELTKEQQLLKSINNILVLKATTNFLATECSLQSLKETHEYLNDVGLDLNFDKLIENLNQYFLENQNYSRLFDIVNDENNPEPALNFLTNCACEFFNLLLFLPKMQKQIQFTQIKLLISRVKEYHDSLNIFVSQGNNSQNEKISLFFASIFVCIFFIFSNYKVYPGLLLLFTTPLRPISPEIFKYLDEILWGFDHLEFKKFNNEKILIQLGEVIEDSEASRFLNSLFQYLLLQSILRLKESSGANTEYDSEFKEVLNEYSFQVRITPFLNLPPHSDLSRTILANNVNTDQILIKSIPHSIFRDNAEASQLWKHLLKSSAGKSFIQSPIFSNKITHYTPPKAHSITLEPEVCLFRVDKDLIHAFCMHPVDKHHFIVASSKDIHEVDTQHGAPHQNRFAILRSMEEAKASPLLNNTVKKLAPRLDSETVSFKRASFPNLNTLFQGNSPSKSPVKSTAVPQKATLPTHHNVSVSHLQSHPHAPYYLSGSNNGAIYLWLYHHSEALLQYRPSGTPRINSIKFNQAGTKFGYCDHSGNLSLYKFTTDAVEANHSRAFWTFNVHSKRCTDFTFCNHGSIIATTGQSKNKQNICIWDVLLNPNRALVASFVCHEESGGQTIIYSPIHQLIISGGKNGDICAIDIRNKTIVKDIKQAHDGNIPTLALHKYERFLLSGSTDGRIKIWELPDFKCVYTWNDAHQPQRFVRPEMIMSGASVFTKGVTSVIYDGKTIYSCGADGRLTSRKHI